jgi:hypothetical protein
MKNDNIKKAYSFFSMAEEDNKTFTLKEIGNATGWKISTVDSYRSKKWYKFLVTVNDSYRCIGFKSLFSSEDVFIRLHRQKSDLEGELLRPKYSYNIDLLIDKARQSSLLAVQIYNNPLAEFRSCGFIVQMVIAFTALFQAIFEREGKEYWYRKDDGTPIIIDGDNKYWELGDCVNEYFRGHQNAESENLRLIINLRNKIEHRLYPTIDLTISGYCQALLNNFEDLIIKNFSPYFSLGGKSLVLALQLTSFSEDQQKALNKIQASNYQEVRKYIDDFCNLLPSEIVQSEKFCFRAFLIPKLGNHATSSDIAIEFIKPDISTSDGLDKYNNQIAFIKEIRVQVADQGMYRPKEVIELVKQRTGVQFSQYLHAKAWKLYNVRSRDKNPSKCNTKYCQYSEPFKDVIYTKAWVDMLCEKVVKIAELEKIRLYRLKDTSN